MVARRAFALLASIRRGLEAVEYLDQRRVPVDVDAALELIELEIGELLEAVQTLRAERQS